MHQSTGTLKKDVVNLPNLLTFARIGMIPLVLLLMQAEDRRSCFFAAMIYTLAAVTDAVDGWLARKQQLISVLGKFLDPLADKLLVVAILIYLVEMGRVAAWAVVVIIARELSITALRTIAMSEGVVIAASQSGKEKTALQMVAIFMLLLHFPYQLDFLVLAVHADLHSVGEVLLYISVVFAVISGGDYVRLFGSAVEAKQRRMTQGD